MSKPIVEHENIERKFCFIIRVSKRRGGALGKVAISLYWAGLSARHQHRNGACLPRNTHRTGQHQWRLI